MNALACAACDIPPGSGEAWMGALTAVILVAGLIALGVRDQKRRDAGKPPPGPGTDMSPFMASLLSGRDVAAYTAPVRAVTPDGVLVRQSRCCARGHQSPAQAVRHAQVIGDRIGTTGR